MKNLFIFLLPIIIASGIANAQLKIELKMQGTEKILGEPAYIEVVFKNIADKDLIFPDLSITPGLMHYSKWNIVGPLKEECQSKTSIKVGKLLAPIPFTAHSEKIDRIMPKSLGIVDLGSYEIWYEYDSTQIPNFWDNYNPSKLKAVSNHLKIDIVLPTGIDAQVFNLYKGKCNDMYKIIYATNLDKLAKEFPTSIYTAWALWAKVDGYAYPNPKFEPAERTMAIILGKDKKKGPEVLKMPGSYIITNNYKDISELFVKNLKDGELRSAISECLAFRYLAEKNFKKAIELYKIGAKSRQRSQDMLQAIAKYLPEYKDLIEK